MTYKVLILEKGQVPFSLIPYSLFPCTLPHISYSGKNARSTMKPLHGFVPLLMLFFWLGICFPSLYVYAQVKSVYFPFALLGLFSPFHLLHVQGGSRIWTLSMGYPAFWLPLAKLEDRKSSQGISFSQLPLCYGWGLAVPSVGALWKLQLCMDSSNVSSPCSVGPKGSRNFLLSPVLGYYGIPVLAFLNIVYTLVNGLFINLSLITQFEYAVSCYNKCIH